MIRQTLVIAVVAALITTPLFALDVITRKSDGKKVNGTISDMSQSEINLKRPGGESEVIPANDVAAIEWEGGGPDLRLGYTDENAGKYETAIARYTKAKGDAKSPSNHLKAEFEYLVARANARIALADPTKQAAAVQQLQTVQKQNSSHFRYFESIDLLGQLQLSMGDYEGARNTYAQLAKAPWGDLKLAAKIAAGRILIAEGKLDEAAKEFESAAAAATDSSADQVRKYEAMLGQARALIAQRKFDEALLILEVVTDKGPAEESALQAEAYVLQGTSLLALGHRKEAALAFLHVDILYPKETSLHAEALYNLSKVWKQVQLPDRSAESEAKLIQNYPNSVWRKKLTTE